MPDLSDTKLKCRMGTAKNFTLLLLLYRTQAKLLGIFGEETVNVLRVNLELAQEMGVC